jgi:hypothetical protein
MLLNKTKNVCLLLLVLIPSVLWADDFIPEQEDDATISADVFTLDGDNTGGDIELKFGETLAESLLWDSTDNRFSLSDSLNLSGNQLFNVRLENAVTPAVACDGTQIGRLYFNTTDSNTYVCNGTQYNPLENVLGNTVEFPAVQARRTTNYTLTTSYTDITLDTTDIENSPAIIDHDDTLRDRIVINETGLYQVIYSFTPGGTATATHEAFGRVRLNDTTVLNGSDSVNKNFQGEYSTTSSSFITSLTSGDFISLQLLRDATADTTQGDIFFSIMKIEGVKGDQGDPGPPGTVGLGTDENVFTLDQDDTGGDITLQFGTVLGEFLRWDSVNGRFQLSADLDLAAAQLVNTRFENLAVAPVCNAGAAGRVYFDTVQVAGFVCDGSLWVELGGSGGGGGVVENDLAVARYRDTGATDINAAATNNLVPWNVEDFEDTVFVHDTATNNSRVQVTEPGPYLVSGSVNVFNDTTNIFVITGV